MVELQTEYKYLVFQEDPDNHLLWWVFPAHGDSVVLGWVDRYAPWKQFCFFPVADTLHSATCLEDIAKFLRQANELYGEAPKAVGVAG